MGYFYSFACSVMNDSNWMTRRFYKSDGDITPFDRLKANRRIWARRVFILHFGVDCIDSLIQFIELAAEFRWNGLWSFWANQCWMQFMCAVKNISWAHPTGKIRHFIIRLLYLTCFENSVGHNIMYCIAFGRTVVDMCELLNCLSTAVWLLFHFLFT